MRLPARRLSIGVCLGAGVLFAGSCRAIYAQQSYADQASPGYADLTDNLDSYLVQAPADRSAPRTPIQPPKSGPKPPPTKPAPKVPVEEPARRPPEQPPPNLLASMYGANAAPAERLAGMPNMFGDLFNNMGGSVVASTFVGPPFSAFADLPLAAASRRAKIAEDDSALPQDRVFFLYNHFENSLDMAASVPSTPTFVDRSFSVDRYTLGFEKTFCNRCWSVELRMPLAGETDFLTPDFSVSGGNVGNLAVIFKSLLYESDYSAVAIGLSIDTPTGSDVQGNTTIFVNPTLTKSSFFTMHNDALHLMPFLGFAEAPTSRFFYQGFVQVDIPTRGNTVTYQGVTDSVIVDSRTLGILDEQLLMYLDVSAGYWLYRNPCACCLTGLASLVEFHYTTTLQDTDFFRQSVNPGGLRLAFANFANRVDIVNVTVGVHAEFANRTLLRVGAAFPLQTGDNRSFDSEVMAQVERRF